MINVLFPKKELTWVFWLYFSLYHEQLKIIPDIDQKIILFWFRGEGS